MTFVANDPLSKLAWSSQKGLRLICVVGSVPKKKSAFFVGAGSVDMVLSPPHTLGTDTNHDENAEDRIFSSYPTTSKDAANEAVGPSMALKSSARNVQTCKSGLRHESGLGSGRRTKSSPETDNHLNARPVSLMPGDFTDRRICDSLGQNENSGQAHPLSPIKGNSLEEIHDSNKFKADALTLKSSSQYEGHFQSTTFLKEDVENKITALSSSCALPLDQLECVAENDLQPSGRLVSDSAVDFGNSLHDRKGQFQLEVCEISKAAPIRALVSDRKGKEKALSYGDLKKGTSEEDDDSYDSVESCNSAGLLSAGKKRVLNLEEQLIVGSKRLKRQIQEDPATKSSTRNNSSFTNWISTMIKGLSKSDEDGRPSVAHPSDGNEKKGLIVCSREQDKKCGNMGFQSLFQSLYRPSPKVKDETLLSSDNYQISEGCEELKRVKSSSEANSNPIRSNPDDLMAPIQNVDSTESLNQSVLKAAQDQLVHSTVLKGNVTYLPLDCKTDASSNRLSLNPDSTVARDIGSSQKFIAGEKTADICGINCIELPSAEKRVRASVNKDDRLGSFLITHFCPKSSGAIINAAQCKRDLVGTAECIADSPRLVRITECDTDCFKDSKSSSGEPTGSPYKKLLKFPLDVERSSIRRIEDPKVNQILRSQRFRSSEAMASVFAKRLDALKHILPTDLAEKANSPATTCFFCGIIGHDLRYCPQVTETEVDELLKSITAYGGAEESSCLCIRCFQLNHWAVACPNAPSRKKTQLEQDAAHLQDFTSSAMWLQQGFGGDHSLLDGKDGRTQVQRMKTGFASSAGCCKSPKVGTSLRVNLEIKESSASMGKVSPILQKVNTASCEENTSQLPGSYPCRSVVRHVFDMPIGIFEAVKSLQLSRTAIMKWMNSMVSTSLDGFYLRLRLGKLGEGLGGTGYHVACICGAQVEKLAETSKRPISVIVGGIRCSVESQFISNQDFLEDELEAWWAATIRAGGKIPSEEELRSRVEERKRLGL